MEFGEELEADLVLVGRVKSMLEYNDFHRYLAPAALDGTSVALHNDLACHLLLQHHGEERHRPYI